MTKLQSPQNSKENTNLREHKLRSEEEDIKLYISIEDNVSVHATKVTQ